MFNTEKKGYSKEEVDVFVQNLKLEYEEQLSAQKERIFELKAQLAKAEERISEHKSRESIISKAIYNAVAKAEEIERVAQEKYELEVAQLKAFHVKWQSYYERIIRLYPLTEELEQIGEFNRTMSHALSKSLPSADELDEIEFPQYSEDSERVYEDERVRLGKSIGGVNLDAISKVLDNEEPEARFENMIKKISGKQGAKPFNPMESIKSYLDGQEASKAQPKKPPKHKDEGAFTEVSESSGFDYEEAQNPKQSLEEIMKELGF